MVSVIIPVYNQAKKLQSCLRSLARQSHADLEVIVVDDGSTDDLEPVLQEAASLFSQRHIPFFVLEQRNQGAPRARNKGFAFSCGEEIIFLDADITLQPQAIARLRQALAENPEAAYAYSSFKFGWKSFNCQEFSFSRLRQEPFIHTSALIKRDYFCGFDEKIKKFQDWDLWLAIYFQHQKGGVWVKEMLFQVKTGGTMSQWLPKFFYHFPFNKLPLGAETRKKYNFGKEILRQKYGLKEK